MQVFLAVVIFHFVEHIAQMVQLYVLHWSRPDCLGILGWWFPWLMRSELLHLAYAVYMLGGLYHFRRQSYHKAWITATHLQSFHLIEHVLLLTQLLFGFEPTGIGGLWFKRIELHFIYNLIVFVPMMIALRLNKSYGVSL
ncbi:MAG: hypothetical protein HC775_16765 [Hyellaceae cyanobacterium CSU_1_1]|nr:hypothetical protein [Hyellaceae cyanobacterium CSU_1_1]